jgi:hypothetical protein
MKLKCKIISLIDNYFHYLVVDKDYKIVTSGLSSLEGWVKHDAVGFHTKERFNKLYGEGNWEVDFSDMYSNENKKITGVVN